MTARNGVLLGFVLFGGVGWGLAAYEHFVQLPAARASTKVSMSLDLVDRFYGSEAEKSYTRLSEALKPWWTSIEDMQRKIVASTNDEERVGLIQKRDLSLNDFIREHKLERDVDMIVRAFDQFSRCISIDTCDEDVLRGTMGVDVRRLYRTFKPWIQAKRDAGEDRDYGRALEELFFRFTS